MECMGNTFKALITKLQYGHGVDQLWSQTFKVFKQLPDHELHWEHVYDVSNSLVILIIPEGKNKFQGINQKKFTVDME